MLLVWHLSLEEAGARAPRFTFCPPRSLCLLVVKNVDFPLQAGGCRLPQLSRPCWHWQCASHRTERAQHVPPRARSGPVPLCGGHRPASSHAEEGCEAPGRWGASGEGTGLPGEEERVPGGLWQSCAGDGRGSRRDPGRPLDPRDHQCADRHPGEPAASGNAVRGLCLDSLKGDGLPDLTSV